MKQIIIDSDQQKRYAKSLIDEMPTDSSMTVTTKKTPKDATYKQQKLWFRWCEDVANSGIGQNDITNDVHIAEKWRIVRPILIEENEIFGILYDHFIKTVKGSATESHYCKEFADKWIHTNDLTRKGRVKSLNDFKKFWVIGHGVNLTDPAQYGVDLKYTIKKKS